MDVAAAIPEIRRRIPSFRNRQVFEEVVVKERSKTEVGLQFGLSQPRVSQIVEQVQDWLRQVVGPEGEDWPAEQRLRYAQNVTQMRLDFQLGEVMSAWRLSQQDKVVRRDSFSPAGELRGWTRTTTNQYGKSSHIGQALQLTLAIARLAGVDVTGKSIRDEVARQRELASAAPAAEPTAEPATEESRQDFEQSKPLWILEPQRPTADAPASEAVVTTSCQPTACTEMTGEKLASTSPHNGAENSYEIGSAGSPEDGEELPRGEEFKDEDWEEVEECDSREARREMLAAV